MVAGVGEGTFGTGLVLSLARGIVCGLIDPSVTTSQSTSYAFLLSTVILFPPRVSMHRFTTGCGFMSA